MNKEVWEEARFMGQTWRCRLCSRTSEMFFTCSLINRT